MKKRFYIPSWRLLLADLCYFLIAFGSFYLLKDYSKRFFLARYGDIFLIVGGIWAVSGYICSKYRPLKESRYRRSVMRLTLTALCTLAVALTCAYLELIEFSVLQTSSLILAVFLQNLLIVGAVHIFYYTAYIDEQPQVFDKREPATVLQPAQRLNDETVAEKMASGAEITSENVMRYIAQHIDVTSSNTLIISTDSVFNYNAWPTFRYDAIVNLEKLNHIRGINKMFCAANATLPDNGRVVFLFESRSTRKNRLLDKWPMGLGWVMYGFDFIIKRVVPKLFLTNRLYYDITKGRNRVLTKTEVLGRLYYCGFAVADHAEIDGLTVVVAERTQQPHKQMRRRYGPLIKLRRIGKNGRYFYVYKLRTMHPYAEYLQQYMYDHHHLREGGKIADDIRVSTLGKFLRRTWLDELPMIINLFRGEMKLVGVRPLSAQYYSLYSKELQEKRTHFKPGLLPPFYADMPKTLDEIQASEMRYLEMCERRGCFVTDNIYFWKILYNILIKRARSH